MNKPLIGFIGQGWIGKNYANDFEKRELKTVRYALEPEYVGNKEKIKACDIVFIAVPTPTTPSGFDYHIVREALALVGAGKTAVIKSTLLPGITVEMQKLYPDIVVLFSPEFLLEVSAAHDASHPAQNIVGLPVRDASHEAAAKAVHAILPTAPFVLTCDSTQAELFKYTHNMSGYVQIMLFNIMYDAATALGVAWEPVQQAADNDPYISNRYSRPVHKSGRGAGGGCFIKDFAAFRELYIKLLPNDARGHEMLAGLEQKNIELLKTSGKDLGLLRGVYGEQI